MLDGMHSGLRASCLSRDQMRDGRALLDLGLFLSDGALLPGLKAVWTDVVPGPEVTIDDCQTIASRHGEWFPHERHAAWVSAAHKLRSSARK